MLQFNDPLIGNKNSLDVDYQRFNSLQNDEGITADQALAFMHLTEAPQPGRTVYKQLIERWQKAGLRTLGDLLLW